MTYRVRRRRLVCAIATAALVGGIPAASVNAATADNEGTRNPPKTKFDPTELRKGKTQAAYVDRKMLHDGKKKLKLNVPHDVWDAYHLKRGYLIETDDPKTGWGVIYYRVGPKGKVTKLRRFPKGVWSVHIDSGGRKVAIETESFSSSGITVFNAFTNKTIRRKKIGKHDVLNYVKGRVLLTRGVDRSKLSWYRPRANTTRKIGSVAGWARYADPGINVIGLGAGPGGSCYDVRRFKAPRERLWRFCSKKGIPNGIQFSPNGKYMLTTVSVHDRPKLDTVVIRRVKNGSVVRKFKARMFSGSVWENGHTFVVEAAAHKKAARVRCTVGGKCRRVSRLVKGSSDFGALDKLDSLFLDRRLLT
ncbi:MAG: hypothetical protein L0K86_06695 [Actinomycetia bacterium]|nr:hypothetical protein [Actinomycetes bacterium]